MGQANSTPEFGVSCFHLFRYDPFMQCRGVFLAALLVLVARADESISTSSVARWTNGPLADPNFFPIAVWLQNPQNAGRYKAAGINIYVGLWRGPNDEQLRLLREAGLNLVCDQNDFALQHKDDKTIIAWMHGDEPDNAQARRNEPGYGPPIKPEVIQQNYQRLHANDPSRPVLLNLGQGVAYDNYIGRGVRRNHPEDYPEYIKGCDIVSFDIYPVVNESKEVAGKLEFVPRGVERLVKWSGGKPVWNCIECTRSSNTETKATPEQVRSEIWMALIHGSRGLIYFVHQFKPNFREAALLDDPEMLVAVTAINKQIKELAPLLNSPTIHDLLEVKTAKPEAPIATMVKKQGKDVYIFSVAMRNSPTDAEFRIKTEAKSAEVIGEARKVQISNGVFKETFKGYEPHIYRVTVD